jgi:hypothetical protein
MKHIMMICGVAISVCTTQAFATEMPKRKSGLWESTMTSAQMQGHKVTSQQCVNAKTDAEMLKKAISNADATSTNCTQNITKRTATGFEMDAVCKQGDGTFKSHMVVTGDFNSRYTMVMTGKLTPPKKGMSNFQSTITARHLGACPSDMKAGDMKVNGMHIRADGMPANITPQQAEEMKKMMEQMKKQMKQ